MSVDDVPSTEQNDANNKTGVTVTYHYFIKCGDNEQCSNQKSKGKIQNRTGAEHTETSEQIEVGSGAMEE